MNFKLADIPCLYLIKLQSRWNITQNPLTSSSSSMGSSDHLVQNLNHPICHSSLFNLAKLSYIEANILSESELERFFRIFQCSLIACLLPYLFMKYSCQIWIILKLWMIFFLKIYYAFMFFLLLMQIIWSMDHL